MTWLLPLTMCILNLAVGFAIGRWLRTPQERYNAACAKEYEAMCERAAENWEKRRKEIQKTPLP